MYLLILFASVFAWAAPNCPSSWRDWKRCKADEECVVAKDECGISRWSVNRRFLSKVDTLRECERAKKEPCPGGTGDGGPKARCHNKLCMRQSDIIDEAIAKDDSALFEQALREAGNVNLSLSHVDETPLTLAALNSRVKLVQFLLREGADLNHQTTTGYTALMFAVMSRDADLKARAETIKLLLQAGADTKLKNMDGETAMGLAKKAGNQDAIKLLEKR